MGAVALRRLIASAALAATALAAAAHDVEGAHAAHVTLRWSFEPWVLACLVASVAAYGMGLARLWRHAGRGRGVSPRQVACFMGGWLCLVAALVSPLDALGSSLFSAHMVQHELMMVVAAPLLVLGRPLAAWAWALPPGRRVAVGRFFRHPAWRRPWRFVTGTLAACVLHAAALWLWHVPAAFDAALSSNAVHAAQHASFLFSALLYWWTVLGHMQRQAQGAALASLFVTLLHTSALGALLALSSQPWYASYAGPAQAAGWDALEDQQLGGFVMWVPAGLAYLVAALAMAARWIAPLRRSPSAT
jgi:cytochrome c oxidase assembly factor CtaG